MATIPIVNTIDKRKGIIASSLLMLLLLIYLLLTTFEIANPPPKDVIVSLAEPMDVTEILKPTIMGGAGSGTPSDDPVTDPKPQTEQIITSTNNPDHVVNTGQGNTTNTPNSQNDPSNTQQSDNPFGDGGNGGGQGGGDGDVFGGSSGEGTNGTAGTGSGKGRIRLNNISLADFHYNTDEKIVLQLVIDSKGNVVQVINIKGKTSTTDQILINKIKVAVKKQIKYNKEAGAPLAKVYYTVNINAQ